MQNVKKIYLYYNLIVPCASLKYKFLGKSDNMASF